MVKSILILALAAAFGVVNDPAWAQNRTNWLYFCQGKDPDSRMGEGTKRYGIKVMEGRRGVILIRAYDWPEDTDSFKLDRGELIAFKISRSTSGGDDSGGSCAKYGWDAINTKYRVRMCTATQGVADIQISESATGRHIFQANCDHVWVD